MVKFLDLYNYLFMHENNENGVGLLTRGIHTSFQRTPFTHQCKSGL